MRSRSREHHAPTVQPGTSPMKYVIDPPRQAALPIRGSTELFPVHRVYCIGRNYAEHAREMGHDPNKEPPFFFQKNPDNLRTDGTFPYPPGTSDVHFEIEMIVALKSGGKRHQAGSGAVACVGLWRRPRHDPARPAGRGQEARPPLGDRQGVRAFGAVHAARARWLRPAIRPPARSGSTSTASGGRPATSTR